MSDRNAAVARLVAVLARGERLAHECASRQAAFTTFPKAARFFHAQARQEHMHARGFDVALGFLGASKTPSTPADVPFERLRQRLEQDLRRGDLPASVIGMQVLFERLGAQTLKRLNFDLPLHAKCFGPLRDLFARQEEAHHAFGTRFIEAGLARGTLEPGRVREAAAAYRYLVGETLDACAALFAELGADRERYVAEFDGGLPAWAQ